MQVVKNKYIVYSMSLHMAETTCARHVPSHVSVYSGHCWIQSTAPTNYCDVTVLASLNSKARKVSRKSCAGYNVSQYF